MGDTEDFNGAEDFSVANNGASGSRFRIVSSKEANGITYGTRQELGLNNGGGSSAKLEDTKEDNGLENGVVDFDELSFSDNVSVRVNQFTIGGDFGQFSLGRGWESGDDMTEMDYSGTYLTSAGGHSGFGGSKVGNIDGGRDDRLRYDSPKIGGILNLAIDFDTSDNIGISAKVGGDNWKAGLYVEDNEASHTDEVGGSIAFKMAGFTAALQLAQKEDGVTAPVAPATKGQNKDADYRAVILGYNVGKFSVAIDFSSREEETGNDKTLDRSTKGLNFNYRPTGGVELYAGLRTAKDDIEDAKTYNGKDSGDAFILGGRVKF
jgi:hypothetical protein